MSLKDSPLDGMYSSKAWLGVWVQAQVTVDGGKTRFRFRLRLL